MDHPPKLAVVIGNAGIKSVGALPIIESLKKMDIQPDLLVGSGGGAVVAALMAQGYRFKDIPQIMSPLYDRKTLLKLDFKSLATMAGMPMMSFNPSSGFLKNDIIRDLYKALFENANLESLKPKTLIQTTNVLTGEGIILEKGSLADAVYASNATYPFFPPAEIGDLLLVDGVFSASLPVSIAFLQNPDIIVAIDFCQEAFETPSLSLIEYYCNFFNRTYTIGQSGHTNTGHSGTATQLYTINVNFKSKMNLWDIEKIPEILEAGEVAFETNKSELMKLLKSTIVSHKH